MVTNDTIPLVHTITYALLNDLKNKSWYSHHIKILKKTWPLGKT